jgi:uncharacterized protein YacL
MKLLNFRTLFTLILSVTLGCFGLWLGTQLPNLPPLKIGSFPELPSGQQLAAGQGLAYFVSMIGLIGLFFGLWLGPKIAAVIVDAGRAMERMSAADKLSVGFGAGLGVMVTLAFLNILQQIPIPLPIRFGISVVLAVIFVYLGIVAMMSMKTELGGILTRSAGMPAAAPAELEPTTNCKILDTNVIIDGRIADVCRTGFLEGPLYVPGFVLEELQHIADSADSLKRARGRRGLDILNSMQKELPLIVRIWDKALDRTASDDEVDTKLVKLARALQGAIVTNDFNLNKVAVLQGVAVLNVNELANSLKPVVLPGEIMVVAVVKEGKEANQGVGYLDDGTMVVVEDGRRSIGDTLAVTVTSVLQTTAGKMIFARVRPDDDADAGDINGGQGAEPGAVGTGTSPNSGGYTRRGQGRPVRRP